MTEELKILITAQIDGLENSCKSASSSISGLADNAEKSGSKVGSSLSKAGKIAGKAMLAVGTACATAGLALTKAVIEQSADLEQSLGGAQAVFGQYADEIVAESEQAYKKMGMSQNQYLESANKMSALFQGAGFSQKEALDMTTSAMQRAADMASVMGISTEDAMNAVNGMAKGNFTMMDNLGVAMNATTLEAYAMSKGFTTAWKDMSQMDKNAIAVQYFMEQTSQYAGNFEREATETISGAIGMLKSSISNFVAGLGTEGANIEALTQNVVDSFLAVVSNISPVVESLINAVPTVLTGLVQALMENLPMLLDAVLNIIESVAQMLIDTLPILISALVQFLTDNTEEIITAGIDLLCGLVVAVAQALPQIIGAIPQIIVSIVKALIAGIPKIIDAGVQLVKGLFEGIKNAREWLHQKLKGWVNDILGWLKNLFGIHSPSKKFAEIGDYLVQGMGKGIKDNTRYATDAIKKTADEIEKAFNPTLTMPDVNGEIYKDIDADIRTRAKFETDEDFGDRVEKVLMSGKAPVYLMVDKKILGQVSVDAINDITRQTGKLALIV